MIMAITPSVTSDKTGIIFGVNLSSGWLCSLRCVMLRAGLHGMVYHGGVGCQVKKGHKKKADT